MNDFYFSVNSDEGVFKKKINFEKKEIIVKKLNVSLKHLTKGNEKIIAKHVEAFLNSSGDVIPDSAALSHLEVNIRNEIHSSTGAGRSLSPAKKSLLQRTLPASVPPSTPEERSRPAHSHSSETIEFMIQKQKQAQEQFKKERDEQRQKHARRKLDEYEQPDFGYRPPNQKYDRERPYLQQYEGFRYQLRPVLMPKFISRKNAEEAPSNLLPVKPEGFVSKREQHFLDQKKKIEKETMQSEMFREQRAGTLKRGAASPVRAAGLSTLPSSPIAARRVP